MIHHNVSSARRVADVGSGRRASCRRAIVTATLVGAVLAPQSLHAQQQRQGELHANYARQTQSESNAWGAGAQLQLVWGAKHAPVVFGTSFGADYLKQEGGGPNSWNGSVDGVLQPGGSATVTPYAGGSIGANWSTGDGAQWSGARLGLETLGGVQVKIGTASAKIEERFGYVRGQEHSLATRLGFQFKL